MSEIIDKIAKDRYLRGDEKTMEDVYERVSDAVAERVNSHIYPIGEHCGTMSSTMRDDAFRKRFYTLMSEGIFLPNTPTLSNAGTDNEMLSACFGLPVNDSFFDTGGIMDGITNAVRIMKMGGGVGFNFSNLRPSGSPVKSTDGVASGPVSFMTFYDAGVEVVKQGGRRRGAAIGILNCDHPDIREFITCKAKEGDIKNFNISVMVTDEFMSDVIRAGDESEENPWAMEQGKCNRILGNKEIFNMIVDGIWNNGEPGILFYDAINKDNPNKHLYDINTTNPCGEIPTGINPVTGGGESCILGSINVSKFYISDTKDNIDWVGLQHTIYDAVVFLDTVIDMNEYPTKAIEEMTKSTRKIGLGFMGLHDLLIKMQIPYDSEQAFNVASALMQFINNCAVTQSAKLARDIGCYPEWNKSAWDKDEQIIRNSTLTCVAPTGTISILAECSSGIEPHYNWVYERKNTVGSTFLICIPLFEEAMTKVVADLSNDTVISILLDRYGVIVYELVENSNEWYIQDDDVEYFGDMRTKLVECIKQECFARGSIQQIDFIPETIRSLFRNALDIPWGKHIYMQSRVQKWCDNSISKTVNMPSTATKDDVRKAIIYAWQQGCKGFTMYRESSRNDVVLKLKDAEPDKKHVYTIPPEIYEPMIEVMKEPMVRERVTNDSIGHWDAEQQKWTTDYIKVTKDEPEINVGRPRVLPSSSYKVTTGCGSLYIHVNEDHGRVREVFVDCGGSGGCEANTNAIGRLISLALKHGVPIRAIIRQLRKVKCAACIKNGKKVEGKSCPDIIGKILEESIPEEEEKKTLLPSPTKKYYTYEGTEDIKATFTNPTSCPECGNEIHPDSGRCITCHNCGYSKCG